MLRECGVTKYAGMFQGAEVELELGAVPAVPVAVDLNREGFAPSNGRSPELNRILERLDPQYSDPALFEIR